MNFGFGMGAVDIYMIMGKIQRLVIFGMSLVLFYNASGSGFRSGLRQSSRGAFIYAVYVSVFCYFF